MPVYRDDRDALRLRVEALRRRVDDCDARVTRAFWRCIPDDDAEMLDALRDEAGTLLTRGDAASVTAAIDAFERYLRRFEEVFAGLDAHEAGWRAVSEPEGLIAPATADLANALAGGHTLTRDFIRVARSLDADARSEVGVAQSDRLFVYSARAALRFEGEPVVLQLAGQGVRGDAGTVRELRAWTTVPRGLPWLLARPETWTESLFRGLRTRRRDGVGDARFDSFFHVECGPTALVHVLTPEVRAALMVIAAVDVPTLSVRPPKATLSWTFAPTESAVAAAVRCVATIRRARVLPIRSG